MRCKDCRSRLLAGPLGTFVPSDHEDLASHLKNCSECTRFLEQQRKLAEGLKRLAAETDGPALSEKTERMLGAAFDRSIAKRQSRMGSSPRLALAFASALCLLVLILAGVRHQQRRAAPVEPAKQAEVEPEQFMAVPYVVPPAPYERTEIVRMQVSLSALQTLGFQVHTAETGGSVTADVLCGQDGRVVAIAILPDSRTKSEGRIEE
jgi:hypothetical protein